MKKVILVLCYFASVIFFEKLGEFFGASTGDRSMGGLFGTIVGVMFGRMFGHLETLAQKK